MILLSEMEAIVSVLVIEKMLILIFYGSNSFAIKSIIRMSLGV
jgi:hypothetical protein